MHHTIWEDQSELHVWPSHHLEYRVSVAGKERDIMDKLVHINRGICTRTPVVRDELVWWTDVDDCGFVTDEHLASLPVWVLLFDGRIDSLKAGDFAGLSNVPILEIRHTSITELPSGVFNGLSRLRKLTVYKNDNLATLHSGTFTGLTLTTYLNLKRNAISALPDNVFDNLLVLDELDLSYNNLTAVPSRVFDNLSQLEELNLGANGLTGLPDGIFENLSALENLELGGNSLSPVPADLFSNQDKLEYLGLGNNGLDDLPDGMFSGLGSLQTLNLWGNQLDDLPDGVFSDLNGLKNLYLQKNQLNDLPDGLFAGWTSLERLTLYENPGAPFVFGLDIAREDDDTIVVNVSNATPFDISITLEATGGSLSATEVILPAGGTSTDGIDVTPDGNGAVAIRVVSAAFDSNYGNGIAVNRGDPLSLGDNNLPTGQPTISGTAQVGQTLTASTTAISDQDGLTNATFEYQWISSDGSVDRDIEGANSSTYAIPATGVGHKLKVLVKFTDDAGNHEIVTSVATGAIEAAPNFPATGKPVIGETYIGRTLTVDLSGISDQNGLPESGFYVKWLCADGDDKVSCGGSEQLHYYMRGLTIKVQISFMDLGGNVETLESEPRLITYPPSPAKGAPVISGVPRVGEWLLANEKIGIYDSNGTENLSNIQWQWIVDDTEVEGETYSSYEVKSTDVGKAIKVRVSFNDDDGFPESLESAPTATVVAVDSSNSPATGAPRINGTPRVGRTLDLWDFNHRHFPIEDADGLTDPVFTYQWTRIDGIVETDIPGATSETYVPVAADEGKTLKVRVSFTDDAGNQETLISASSSVVAPAPTPAPENNPAAGAAVIAGTARVGETLTVDVSGITDADGMENATFNFSWFADYDTERNGGLFLGVGTGNTWTILPTHVGKKLTVVWSFQDDLGNWESGIVPTATVKAIVPSEPRAAAVQTGGTGELVVSWVEPNSNGGSDITGYTVQWKKAVDGWDMAADVSSVTTTETSYIISGLSPNAEYSVRVFASNSVGDGPTSAQVEETVEAQQRGTTQNTPATGTPTISGTAQLGERLTIDTSTIADEDGILYAVFYYNLFGDYSVERNGGRFLGGGSYNPNDEDDEISPSNEFGVRWLAVGMTITLVVSFVDDAGNFERLVSVPTARVPGPLKGVTLVDTSDQSDRASLTYHPSKVILDNPANGSYGFRVDLSEQAEVGSVRWEFSGYVGSNGVTRTDNSVPFSLYGEDANGLLGDRLPAGDYFIDVTAYPESDNSGAPLQMLSVSFEVSTANTPATGAPTISGTAQVGYTLTADVSGISDVDRLTNVDYSYQWLADDAEIESATSTAYTLRSSDAGKAIKVRVSFTDDAGHEETLTSTSTVVVVATVPGAPRSVDIQPSGTGQLAVSWESPSSNGGSDITRYTVQWKEAADNWDTPADVSSATTTATTHTISRLSLGTEYSVRVVATNSIGDGPPSADETATADAQISQQQAVINNTPAAGAPTISGGAQVGQNADGGHIRYLRRRWHCQRGIRLSVDTKRRDCRRRHPQCDKHDLPRRARGRGQYPQRAGLVHRRRRQRGISYQHGNGRGRSPSDRRTAECAG